MDILELITREQKTGYHDAAVFGGFGIWICQYAKSNNLPALIPLAQAYTTATARERRELLSQISQLLQSSSAEPSPTPKQDQSGRQAPFAANAAASKNAASPTLDLPLVTLKNVGPKRAEQLARLDLHTLEQLLHHLPRSYHDRRETTPLAHTMPGNTVNVRGRIISCDRYMLGSVRVVPAVSKTTQAG